MKKSVCGIYKITSPSNKVYIGQSLDIERRFSEYKKLKCKGQKALYWSLNKYGFENHFFEILEECKVSNLNDRERYYQDLYDVLKKGLNCRLTKSNDKCGELSEETKKKISINSIGRKHSEEAKKNMSLSQTGRKHSEETKKKMGLKSKGNQVWLGKKHSEETKRKMSDKSRGRRHTEESKRKMSESSKGKVISLETKIKISNSIKGKKQSIDHIDKRIENLRKIVLDTSNGVFYKSIKEASDYINMDRRKLSYQLNGKYKNKTNLIIV